MKLEYIEQNGDEHTIDTDKCTKEELEEFAYNDVYDFVEVTAGQQINPSISDLAYSYAYDKYENILDKQTLINIINDVVQTLSWELLYLSMDEFTYKKVPKASWSVPTVEQGIDFIEADGVWNENILICSHCGNEPLCDIQGEYVFSSYCPHCGAIME